MCLLVGSMDACSVEVTIWMRKVCKSNHGAQGHSLVSISTKSLKLPERVNRSVPKIGIEEFGGGSTCPNIFERKVGVSPSHWL